MKEISYSLRYDQGTWKIVFESGGMGVLAWSRETSSWSAFWETLLQSSILRN
jgi:hypothetical protein